MVKALVIDEENVEINYFLKAIRRRLNDKALLEEQRDVFNDFYKHLRVMESSQPLKEATILNNFNILHDFALFVRKPFNEVTEDDLKEYFLKMVEEGKKHNTIALKKMVIKRFFKFLNGGESYPTIVKGIKATTKPKKRLKKKLW